MTIRLVTDEKVAETSSKGNQEKWFDKEHNAWYKLDQFGYEALAETLISNLLEHSNLSKEIPFSFARYQMVRINVHGRDRTGCMSENFLKQGQSIITLSHLFSRYLGTPLRNTLEKMTSDKKRMAYLADATAEFTGLKEFGFYLTLLFEIDALFLNDDRHLNNIAVIEENGSFDYCPIFDNGAALLSNMQVAPMNLAPKALVSSAVARPFNTTFTRQINTMRGIYGRQLKIPRFSKKEIADELKPLLEFYAERDRGIILDRVTECIITRQKFQTEGV